MGALIDFTRQQPSPLTLRGIRKRFVQSALRVLNSYKEAHVCPVPKKSDLSAVNNYRPISLLNSEDKRFGCLVFKHLYNHLQTYNLLSSLQSGFIPGDSTVDQLTYLYTTSCQALDSSKDVRVVFCDISKAFDRVWHARLLLKLEAAGVRRQVLEWFKSYLTNRKQRVTLAYSRISHEYSSLFIIVINLIFMFSL